MNGAITALANKADSIGPEEKKMAVEIITDWEHNVIDKLNSHGKKADAFLRFLDRSVASSIYDLGDVIISIDQQEEIAEKTRTKKQFNEYIVVYEEFKETSKNAPDKPVIMLNMSIEERIEAEDAYRTALAKHGIIKEELAAAAVRKYNNWKKALQKNEEIKILISRIKAYKRNLQDFVSECKCRLGFLYRQLACTYLGSTNIDELAAYLTVRISEDKSRPKISFFRIGLCM